MSLHPLPSGFSSPFAGFIFKLYSVHMVWVKDDQLSLILDVLICVFLSHLNNSSAGYRILGNSYLPLEFFLLNLLLMMRGLLFTWWLRHYNLSFSGSSWGLYLEPVTVTSIVFFGQIKSQGQPRFKRWESRFYFLIERTSMSYYQGHGCKKGWIIRAIFVSSLILFCFLVLPPWAYSFVLPAVPSSSW